MAEPRPESREPREYGFEDGTAEAVRRILELYAAADHDLVIVINGSGINVGKSRVQAAIERALIGNDIMTSNISGLTRTETASRRLEPAVLEAMLKKPHMVFFYTAHNLETRKGESFNDMRRHAGDSVPVDFSVAVYRPDRPFTVPEPLELVADITIRNGYAVDK